MEEDTKIDWRPIEEPEVKWLGVDFDKTICNSSGHPHYIPGVPYPGTVSTLQKLDALGYKIIIFTARHWADYHNIERYCIKYEIPARRIVCGKPLFKWMIDDRNLEFNPDKPLESWESILNRVSDDTDSSESKGDTPESSPNI